MTSANTEPSDAPACETEEPETWRTIAEPDSDVADALCLLAELWCDRCWVGYEGGKFDVSPRYTPTDDQERRLARYRGLIGRELLPWCVPMRRTPEREGSRAMVSYLAFDRVYAPGVWKGWH